MKNDLRPEKRHLQELMAGCIFCPWVQREDAKFYQLQLCNFATGGYVARWLNGSKSSPALPVRWLRCLTDGRGYTHAENAASRLAGRLDNVGGYWFGGVVWNGAGEDMVKRPRIDEVSLLPNAAKAAGVPRSTVQEAIKRGEIVAYPMADGTSTYCVDAIRQWKEKRHGAKRTR